MPQFLITKHDSVLSSAIGDFEDADDALNNPDVAEWYQEQDREPISVDVERLDEDGNLAGEHATTGVNLPRVILPPVEKDGESADGIPMQALASTEGHALRLSLSMLPNVLPDAGTDTEPNVLVERRTDRTFMAVADAKGETAVLLDIMDDGQVFVRRNHPEAARFLGDDEELPE